MAMTEQLIEQQGDMPHYVPPGHEGTVNVRLVDRGFNGAFELVHGTVQPGGETLTHHHETEHQVIYVVAGAAEVTLGADAPVGCGPGCVIRIPPKLDHRVVSVGQEPLRVLIVYSPPLPDRDDRPVTI